MPVVLTRTERRIPGVKTRRAKRLDPQDATTRNGIPVTTVVRTLVDLPAEHTEAELARACHEAGVKYGTTPRQVEEVLARRSGVAGARRLRRVTSGDVPVTLSRLESRFLKLLREAHARGDQFRRYTYGDVFEDPRPMLAELCPLLRHPAPS